MSIDVNEWDTNEEDDWRKDDFDDNEVIELHSSDDESVSSNSMPVDEDMKDPTRTTMKEFKAYFEYLQKCVTKISFEQELQENTSLCEHFHKSIKCIETEIELHSQMFDRYTRKHQWSKQVKDCIQSSSLREIKEISHNLNDSYCHNCSSQRRIAKYTLVFSGYSLDASRLYELGWTKRLGQ